MSWLCKSILVAASSRNSSHERSWYCTITPACNVHPREQTRSTYLGFIIECHTRSVGPIQPQAHQSILLPAGQVKVRLHAPSKLDQGPSYYCRNVGTVKGRPACWPTPTFSVPTQVTAVVNPSLKSSEHNQDTFAALHFLGWRCADR